MLNRIYLKTFLLTLLLSFTSGLLQENKNNKNKDNVRKQDDDNKEKESKSISASTMDPHKTWLTFVKNQQSNKNHNRPRQKQRTRKLPIIGPAGPRGPRGPAGPPGAQITEAAMMAQFRNLVRDTASRRTERFAGQSFGLLAAGVPDVLSGLHVELKRRFDVPRKKLRELREFQATKHGTFVRGSGFDFNSGRYTVPYTAVYQFHVSLHLARPIRESNLLRKDYVTIMVCINGQCKQSSNLSVTSGLSSNSRVFTVHTQGILFLMASQYVSIFLENHSGYNVAVLDGSSFSGILLGA